MSRYTVYVTPRAWDEIKMLPGHVRQRVRRVIAALADEPRPSESKELLYPSGGRTARSQPAPEQLVEAPSDPVRELRRIRLERWRIVYAITEADQAIDVLTIRKRPPYDYGDLEQLLATS